tara:strand:- start:825 stop:1454 length:630 start_codon:yes stop_codon:yes gene_type:complete
MFPEFSFKVTDGKYISEKQTFRHLTWDGRRAFSHIVKNTPSLITPYENIDIEFLPTRNFRDSVILYLESRNFSAKIQAALTISTRPKFDDTTPGNFIVIHTFIFDPNSTFISNRLRVDACIEEARQFKRTMPWRIMQISSTSKVNFNVWDLHSDDIFIYPEVYRDPSVNNEESTYVILSNIHDKWYIRYEANMGRRPDTSGRSALKLVT